MTNIDSCTNVKITNEEQILNGFAEMMKGLWGNQNLEIPNLETLKSKRQRGKNNRWKDR